MKSYQCISQSAATSSSSSSSVLRAAPSFFCRAHYNNSSSSSNEHVPPLLLTSTKDAHTPNRTPLFTEQAQAAALRQLSSTMQNVLCARRSVCIPHATPRSVSNTAQKTIVCYSILSQAFFFLCSFECCSRLLAHGFTMEEGKSVRGGRACFVSAGCRNQRTATALSVPHRFQSAHPSSSQPHQQARCDHWTLYQAMLLYLCQSDLLIQILRQIHH